MGEVLKSPAEAALRAKRQAARPGGERYPRRGYPRIPNAADAGMALNPQGDQEIRLGRRWVRRDIPFRYASASPALAEPYFPPAQTPPEIFRTSLGREDPR